MGMMGLRKVYNLHFFLSNSINLKFAEFLHFKQQRNVLHVWLASDSPKFGKTIITSRLATNKEQLLNAEEMVVAKLQELKENQALVNVVVDN